MKVMRFDPPPWTHLEFPSTFEDARAAEMHILDACAQWQFEEQDLFDVRMALHEALLNAVKHGNKLDPTKRVDVRYKVERGRLEVTIEDQGSGFNPDNVPDPTADENLERPSGRGILLMRAYMNSVVFNSAGNKVTLTKRAEAC